MALILSLETSSKACSVALHNDRELIKSLELNEAQAHASKLALLLSDILKGSKIEINRVDAIAVSAGPGSYTGLRIGTSTAKGICFALNIPLIAVKTLQLLAWQVQDKQRMNGLLCPMIDAKRMEVYCQVMNSDLQIISPVQAKVIDETSFKELLQDHKLFFFGDGAEKCKSVVNHVNANFIDDVYPSASALGRIAFLKFRKKEFEDLKDFVPFYLKDFVEKKAQTVF